MQNGIAMHEDLIEYSASRRPDADSAWFGRTVAVSLIVVTLLFRLYAVPYESSDYVGFLSKWFDVLKSQPGLAAFATPFSDYAPLYLYGLKLLTLIPIPSLWSIKALSTLFDVGVATATTWLILLSRPRYSLPASLLFAVVFSIPTLAMNSGLWGQCDAGYTLAAVMSLCFIATDRPRRASVMLGVAISLKLQTVFLIPILAGYLLRRRAVQEVLWVPVIFLVTCIPALLAGAPLSRTVMIYLHQAGEYTSLTMTAPNVFALLGDWAPVWLGKEFLTRAGIVAGALAGSVALLCMWRAQHGPRALVLIALWCTIAMPYVLPRMHERYFFLADVLAIAYALIEPRRSYVAVLVVGGSMLSYAEFLSTEFPRLKPLALGMIIPSTMMTSALVIVTAWLVSQTVTVAGRVTFARLTASAAGNPVAVSGT